MTSTIARAHDRKPPSNTPLQPTAFGAQDRWYFSAFSCSAPRRRLMRTPLGAPFIRELVALLEIPLSCRSACLAGDQNFACKELPMGASAWAEYIPYHPDFLQALRAAQTQAFAAGDYLLDFDTSLHGYDLPLEQRPKTVQELCRRTGSVTYTYFSLISEDISHWHPVSAQVCTQLFGTATPAIALVKSAWDWNKADGQYVIAYADSKPIAYFLWGCDEDY